VVVEAKAAHATMVHREEEEEAAVQVAAAHRIFEWAPFCASSQF